jgi:exodeoxyribonuclease VII large subunit
MEQENINGIPLLTVAALSQVVENSISGIYPSGVWIEGEIAELKATPHSTGHYFSLIDGVDDKRRAVPMRLWKRSGSLDRVMAKMSQLGIPLENGMRVRFLCKLNFYTLKGEFSLVVNDIDPQFTLGNIAAKRDQLIAKLVGQGLDKVNKKIAVPSMPLSLGVVSSVQADAWQDALKQFRESQYAFRLVFCASAVQGLDAPEQLVAAIRTLDRRDDVDIILLIRGGGSKADLAAFDDERVAMAIVNCRHPVFTGIGHAPDVSVADIVAHTTCKTPTAVAEEIIAKVRRFERHILNKSQLVATHARRSVATARGRVNQRASRIAHRPPVIFASQRQRLENATSILRLLYPVNTLAKGWTITRDSSGTVIRSSGSVKAGDLVTTVFVDGSVSSEIKEKI